ncbi:hypothetical protein [Prosthecobacter sp.]|uniref:hypothetical protein n=1 Tax=Prosthecobacter sp. TaxID=1965333 RepID=UPI003783399E
MRPHTLTRLLILLAAAMLVSCSSTANKPSQEEQANLLGPHASKALRWTKVAGPDFNVYHGFPTPPFQGEVGFYLGGHPSFKPAEGDEKHAGRLGIHKVTWHRKHRPDGSFSQATVFPMGDYWKVHAWVHAYSVADLAVLTRELSAVDLFSKSGPPKRE